jgi:hypothetical protein
MKNVEQLYEVLPRTEIRRALHANHEPALRLYCENADQTWNLQVRGVLLRADGSAGRDFVVATAPLNREQMLALRKSIDEHLEEYAEFRDPEDLSATNVEPL